MIRGIYSGQPREEKRDYYLALRMIDAGLHTVLRTGGVVRRRDINPKFGFLLDDENRLRVTP
jgi:hypothetical protein